jgi:TetR/AcrR family transcriptional regulator, lmrAB and yxaGH operons repressor
VTFVARPATIDDEALMARLSCVFRDSGYNGASLSSLSEAAGLRRASLYHRFPGGKEQMANEVLAAAEAWLGEHVLTPLRGTGEPAARIAAMRRALHAFYSGGKQSCLLNLLSAPFDEDGPFAAPIKRILTAWRRSLVGVLRDAGFEQDEARRRAERAIALVQGSLVLSRGLRTTRPFERCLASLEHELLAR